ncbi:uncharacterized protein METZ01_LOCUS286057, partial [marine metagenome]
ISRWQRINKEVFEELEISIVYPNMDF